MRKVIITLADNGWLVEDCEVTEVYTDLKEMLNAVMQVVDLGDLVPSPYNFRVEIVDTKEHEYAQTVIVTRHKALLELLKEKGVIFALDYPFIEHATLDSVKGKHVIGVLPLHLACLAASITEVELDVPAELRGVELSIEQLRECYRGVHTYKVKRDE